MKPSSSASFALAALAAALFSVAPQAAADDKKPAAQPPASTDEYRIGAGDKLRIEVYKDQQLSQSVQVRPDGKITLPLVGDVVANGRTPIELRDVIATALKEYVTNPTVTVIIVEALASQVFVMGEVSKPGAVQIFGPTTMFQVLALAGGFKEFANTKDVRVVRQNGTGVQTIRFNYKEALNSEAKPFFVRPGDTVIVP
jgi:polysaccharide export outer membrane protein